MISEWLFQPQLTSTLLVPLTRTRSFPVQGGGEHLAFTHSSHLGCISVACGALILHIPPPSQPANKILLPPAPSLHPLQPGPTPGQTLITCLIDSIQLFINTLISMFI